MPSVAVYVASREHRRLSQMGGFCNLRYGDFTTVTLWGWCLTCDSSSTERQPAVSEQIGSTNAYFNWKTITTFTEAEMRAPSFTAGSNRHIWTAATAFASKSGRSERATQTPFTRPSSPI